MMGKRLVKLQFQDECNCEMEMLEDEDMSFLEPPARIFMDCVWSVGFKGKEDILGNVVVKRWRNVGEATPRLRRKMVRRGIG